MWRFALVAVVSACVSTETIECDDGTTCAAGTECRTVVVAMVDTTVCAEPDQITPCAGQADGTVCSRPEAMGSCHDEVCLVNECGNYLVDSNEMCDDGGFVDFDGCSADCSSTETCGNGVIDTALGEECEATDDLGHDGCSSGCQVEEARWVTLPPMRPLVISAAAAYDARRRRTLVFGGIGNGNVLNETIEWDGARWYRLEPGISPSARSDHAMAFDAERGEMILFGGSTNTAETWAWNGSWRLVTSQYSPQPRTGAHMVYDSGRRQIVLWGGVAGGSTVLTDTWIWNGTEWRMVNTTPPSARNGAMMAYDPARNVTVLVGGELPSGLFTDEVWEFDGTTWTERTPGIGPSPRGYGSAAYDPVGGGVVIAGGYDIGNELTDAYRWNGTSWTVIASLPGSNFPYVSGAMATDTIRGRIVFFPLGRVLEYDGVEWTVMPQTTISSSPPGSLSPAMVLDSDRGELVLFGGLQTSNTSADTFVYNGGWGLQSPDNPPSGRWGAGIAYDEVRKQVVMYGGCVGSADTPMALEETHLWNGVDWTNANANQPGKLCQPGMAFDAARGEVVMFGGLDDRVPPEQSDKTWAWNGSAWVERQPATHPTPRSAASLAYDRTRREVVLFGGVGSGFESQGDTWTWDGTNWRPHDGVVRPGPRGSAAMAWDPASQRVVLAGGGTVGFGQFAYSDAWGWDGTAWSVLPDIGSRVRHAMATAPDGAGVVLFGGAATREPPTGFDDLRRLRYDSNDTYESCADFDGDGDALAGCDDPDCWWVCTPMCSPGTTCASNASRCGDGVENSRIEQCFTCPIDTGPCGAHCGDFSCQSTESPTTCPGDCL